MVSVTRLALPMLRSIARLALSCLVVAGGVASIVGSGGGEPEVIPDSGTQVPMSVFPQRYTFGGEALSVRVVLAEPVRAGTTAEFSVTSTLPSGAIGLPGTLSIPAGGSELNFDIATQSVDRFIDGRVDVTWTNRVDRGAAAPFTSGQPTTLMPEPQSIQLSFAPAAVPGGQSSILQVAINPVYPIAMAVELSADSALVQVPAQLGVNAGASGRTQSVTTNTTDTATPVNVTARVRGVVDIETLLVNTTQSGQLPLDVAVNGGGRVVSSPAGIDCTGECSALFNIGSVVTLTPQPDAGQRFFGWGGHGDCSDGVVTLATQRGCTAIFTPQLTAPPSGSAWTQLGATLAEGSEVDPTPSLQMDGANPVVAYVEALAGDAARLHVRRLEGGTWVALGGAALNAGGTAAASEPALLLTPQGMPYVAWVQGNGVQQNLFVSRFNGSDWESVGAAGVPLNALAGTAASGPSLAFDIEMRPMVAWIENGAARFKRFDGSAWVQVDRGGGLGSPTADRVRLVAHAGNGIPVLVWSQGSGANRMLRAARDFTLDPLLEGPINDPPAADRRSIPHFGVLPEFSGAFVAWGQGIAPFDILTRRWNGTAWEDVGSNRIMNNNPNTLVSLSMDRRSLAVAHSHFVANADASTAAVSVYNSNSNTWLLAVPPISGTLVAHLRSLSLDMPSANSPVLAASQRDANLLFTLRVRRYFGP